MYKGIDIFSDDVITSWQNVKNDGVKIVYIKATQGVTYKNPKMYAQYKGAKSVGLLVGFYHFASRNNPNDEYNFFMNTIKNYSQDIKPCLDYEVANPNYNFISTFMNKNKDLILYSMHSIADNTSIPKNRIWIAEPRTYPSNLKGYAGIQYTWTGKVNGISNENVDIDFFGDEVLYSQSNKPNPSQPDVPIQEYTLKDIQSQLNSLINAGLVVDGINGPATINAVKNFQSLMGLSIDGIAGNDTISAIKQIRSYPLDGVQFPHYEYATRWIQWRVRVSVDGIFGNGTASAVKNFQAVHGLQVDGIVGQETWKAMFKY